MKISYSFKNIGLILSACLIVSFNTYAQPCSIVGNPGFSPGAAYYTSMAIDHNNIPYVAFQDTANNYAVTVMKYNGLAWTVMGAAGFSPANATSPSMALNSADTAYVAYVDGTNGSKVSVMKFNGTNWVYKGAPDFSDSASSVSLALGINDTVYVALVDGKDSSRITVMKFNGANWVNVGLAGFTDSSDDVSLAIDGVTGIPYVAFTDVPNGSNATVMKYMGGSWTNVGVADFSAGGAAYLSLTINKSSVPILAYQDGANLDKATVMEYNGSNWINLGSAGFSKASASYTSLALDSAGVPFVAYQDAGYGSAATIAEYNGSTWVSIGSPGCTAGTADYTSLAIDRHGRLYVAFQDGSQSSHATVVTYQHCNTGNPTIIASANGKDTICPGTAANLSASGANNYAWSTGDSTSNSTPILTDTNAVYSIYVTGIAANGCASTDSINVYTRPVPHLTISGPDSVCSGGSAIMDVNGGALSYIWSTGSTATSINVNLNSDTVFYVSGKGANGCSDTARKKITMIYGPVINLVAAKDTICKGDSTTLTASGGISYIWFPSGSTTNPIMVMPNTETTFTTQATGSNGCKSVDSITVYIDTACNLSINEVNFSLQFNLAPNPAHNIIYLTSNTALSNAHVKVYNLLGQIIEDVLIDNLDRGSPYALNISSFSNGIYYLRLIVAEGAAVYKIVKD